MQTYHLLLLLPLFTLSTALTMNRPLWLLYQAIDPLQAAITLAYKQANLLTSPPPACTALTNIVMDQGALPPPTAGLTLYHIGLGRGTQNYSCPTSAPATAAPQQLGATATLFNITCLKQPSSSSVSATLMSKIAKLPRPAFDMEFGSESGHHYFTNGNTTATFNLHQGDLSLTKNLGITFAKKSFNVSAPADAGLGSDGSKAVPWLKLATIGTTPVPATPVNTISQADASVGGGVKEIYRVNTVGGAAPATCAGLVGQEFTKEYAAEYWFWH